MSEIDSAVLLIKRNSLTEEPEVLVVAVLGEAGPRSHHPLATRQGVCEGDHLPLEALLSEQLPEPLQELRSILSPGLGVDEDQECDTGLRHGTEVSQCQARTAGVSVSVFSSDQ